MMYVQQFVSLSGNDTLQCICPECGISVEGMDKLGYHKSLITNYKQITNYTQVSQEESQNLQMY